MRVGVVIPVYNRPKLVLEALGSVLNQTKMPDSVIVIDDGSTDNTAASVKEFIEATKSQNTQIFSLARVGAASSRNFGFQQLPHDIETVAFLDSDDIWPKDFLQRCAAALVLSPDAVAVSCDGKYWEVDEDRTYIRDTSALSQNPWHHMIVYGAGIASCTLFRATQVREEGGFPPEFPTGHDNVLFSRLANRGKWLHVPGAPVIFRRNYQASFPDDHHHLHLVYPNYRVHWAYAVEQSYNDSPYFVRADKYTKISLRDRWMEAGRQAISCADQKLALYCFVRALAYTNIIEA
ncbi:hypothetical protein AMST5_00856 [freshwater sediment metagenome]|uniref:Glycosyltransferase 2-like domain-containing protein n=1 Tax=freshwater sediment metagenome TaxID=556182 RepID=A0AA48LZ12_9ZZZZ